VGLADYYGRAALAASQVLGGFDGQAFEHRLSSTSVGIATSANAANSSEGRLITDLSVRLLARLYPALDIWGPPDAAAFVERMRRLARATNPAINLTRKGRADTGISVGDAGEFGTTVFAGSEGWDALISTSAPRPLGTSSNPLGAGVAACLASANVFRRIFLEPWESTLDDDLRLSAWTCGREPTPAAVPNENWRLDSDAVLVGVGAIGMAASWAWAHAPMEGSLHLVDPEDIDLGNLQRYVLATSGGTFWPRWTAQPIERLCKRHFRSGWQTAGPSQAIWAFRYTRGSAVLGPVLLACTYRINACRTRMN
jgi:hypothetical protein